MRSARFSVYNIYYFPIILYSILIVFFLYIVYSMEKIVLSFFFHESLLISRHCARGSLNSCGVSERAYGYIAVDRNG
jgi:hypothetical protein